MKLLSAAILCLVASGSASGQAVGDYKHLVLDGAQVKWGAPVAGTRADVTYAVVAAPRHFPGARNCADIEPPVRLLRASGLTRSAFDDAIARAFGAWSEVADIDFRPTDADTADILIGAQKRPRGRAFTNVEYRSSDAAAEMRTINRAVICLNPTGGWKIGFDGNLDVYDLRYTMTHEIGHAIGLDHPSSGGQIMDYRYDESVRELQPGDARGVASLYGPSPVETVVLTDKDDASDADAASSLALGNEAGSPPTASP